MPPRSNLTILWDFTDGSSTAEGIRREFHRSIDDWSPTRKTALSPGSLSQASSTFVSGQTCINSGAYPIVTFEATERCALGGRERPDLHFTSMVSNSRPYERRPEYQLASLHPMSPGPRSTAATAGVWGRWRRLSWLSLFLLTIPLHRKQVFKPEQLDRASTGEERVPMIEGVTSPSTEHAWSL